MPPHPHLTKFHQCRNTVRFAFPARKVTAHFELMRKGLIMKVPALVALLALFGAKKAIARDFQVYNISLEVPMADNAKSKKNFYINMGTNQGLEEGTIVDVFRIVSRIDPYDTKTRFNHKVKIGEIKILHSGEDTAIGALHELSAGKDDLYFEVDGIMIGDRVGVKIEG